jgi:hypothetical protein
VGEKGRDGERDEERDTVREKVGDTVGDTVREKGRDGERDEEGDTVSEKVGDRVGDTVREKVGDRVRRHRQLGGVSVHGAWRYSPPRRKPLSSAPRPETGLVESVYLSCDATARYALSGEYLMSLMAPWQSLADHSVCTPTPHVMPPYTPLHAQHTLSLSPALAVRV